MVSFDARLLRTLRAVLSGDRSARLPAAGNGLEGEIAEALNRLLDSVDSSASSDWAACLIGFDGAIRQSNPSFERMVGRSRDDLIARLFVEMLPRHDRSAVQAELERLRHGVDKVCFETRSDSRCTSWTAIAFPSERVYYAVGRDSTERKQTEDSQRILSDAGAVLASSLDYETTLFNVAHLAVSGLADICMIDILEEPGWIRRLAVAHADPASVSWTEELRGRFSIPRGVKHGTARVLDTGSPEILEEIAEPLEGIFPIVAAKPENLAALRRMNPRSMMCVPLQARGQTIGVISFVSITPDRRYRLENLHTAEGLAHRAALAIDNARLYREAQEAIRCRDQFLSIASHELKTPLTSIQLRLQSILRAARRGLEENPVIPMVEDAERQGWRLARLINELLDVARITSGKFRLEREDMDLSAAVQAVLERFQEELHQKKYSVTFHPSPSPGNWDRLRLEQAITNLLSNAIKYGEGKPIEVSIHSADESVSLEVKDGGMGMQPELLRRLFHPFERGQPTNHYGGLGLGLYIVRQIVEAHGGSIGVQSEPGRGSRFTMKLPARVTSLART
jgi:PAS domain S-box-containing protein